jgi:sugar lactone lactonase YvrE
MNIETLDTPEAILGEGIFFDESSFTLFWVDIIGNKIFQFSTHKQELIEIFDVPLNPSSILDVESNKVIFTNNKGVASLDLGDRKIKQLSKLPHDSCMYRSNDGVKLSDGSYIFGTMGFKPDDKVGNIYKGKSVTSLEPVQLGIHIPNTFIELKDELLISDSYKQLIYSISKDLQTKPRVWANFSNESFTPDGGIITKDQRIFITMWGGSRILELSNAGEIIQSIALPVLQPTNCVIANDNYIYITSAKEGLNDFQLANFPLSGKTFRFYLGNNNEN